MRVFSSVALCLIVFLSSASSAQVTRDRAKTWEFGALVFGSSSESLNGESGSGLDIDSETGWGFTGAYNFTNRFAVMGELSWVRPRYQAEFVPENGGLETINARLDISNFQVKGVFNLLDGPITPFIEGGLGWTRVDSNIISSPPITGCWWDPWWGYICDTFFNTYSDTRTSFSYAGGLRWEFTSEWSVRASYGVVELDTSSNTQDFSMDNWRVDFAWRF